MKTCKKCGVLKLFKEFTRNVTSSDGLYYICRECNSRRIVINCTFCGKGFIRESRGKFCSVPCRFWFKVNKTDTCWLWEASKDRLGYGQFWDVTLGRMEKAHRVSYWLYTGNKPNLDILHTCDNPPCVNPDHLYLGTHKDNMRDMMSKGRNKRVFVKGHPSYTPLGESHGLAKLKNTDIPVIRELATTQSYSHIARLYGMDPSTIADIVKYKTWKHI